MVWVTLSDMWVSHDVADAREHRIPAVHNLNNAEGEREEKVISNVKSSLRWRR